MKKAFKLFGLAVVAMAVAVACGNANNAPAEEEIVAEEATEEVVEEVQVATKAPATQAVVEEETETVKAEKVDAKEQLKNEIKTSVENQKAVAGAAIKSEADAAKEKLDNELKDGLKAAAAGAAVKVGKN